MTKPRKVLREEGGSGRFTDSAPVMNLGHPTNQDGLTENPASHQRAYEGPNSEVVRSLTREQNVKGQYAGRTSNLESGISTAQNLGQWSNYAKSNSYKGDPRFAKGYPKNKDR